MAARSNCCCGCYWLVEGTDTRAFGLLIGAAPAMVWPSRRLSEALAGRWRVLLDGVGLLGLVVIALLIWGASQYSPFLYHGGIVLLSVATAATVAALVHPASWLGVAVGWKPLRWLGVRSYGIYLWHWPIIVLTAPSLYLQALQVAATIIIAALSWRFFEEPIRRGAIGRLWGQVRSGQWRRRTAVPGRTQRRRRFVTGTVVVLAFAVLALDGVGLSGLIKAQPETSGLAATSQQAPSGPGVSTHQTVDPSAARPEESARKTSSRQNEADENASRAALPNTSSCRSVAYIGDSTSEGMVLPNYLPKASQRLGAQYARVGATSQFLEISGARSIVETLSREQAGGLALARELKAKGFDGCYVIGLGTNDTANVYVGSAVGLDARIDQMMRVMGDQPVLWVTVRSLLTSGPYSEENMQLWNGALEDACSEYPNMRIFDWASLTEDDWYIEDGTHYTSEGYRHRARLTANGLAHAFPASGDEKSSSCVVR